MRVHQVMSTEPVTCNSDMPVTEVAYLMKKHNCGEIPIYDSAQERRVVGVITDRDIACRVVATGRNARDLAARSIMTMPAYTVLADEDLDRAVELMQRRKVRRLPVVDNAGRCVGMLSQVDITRASAQLGAEVLRETTRTERARH